MTRLHHVNVVVPPGMTEAVAAFYSDVIGLRRIGKPFPRPGAWFDVDGFSQLHVSERDGERHPDAHFGLVVDDFDAVLARVPEWTGQEELSGCRRGFTRDPAGNRVELIEGYTQTVTAPETARPTGPA